MKLARPVPIGGLPRVCHAMHQLVHVSFVLLGCVAGTRTAAAQAPARPKPAAPAAAGASAAASASAAAPRVTAPRRATDTELAPLLTKAAALAKAGADGNALLAAPELQPLREVAEFRALVRDRAPAGDVTLAPAGEPGTRMLVRGVVADTAGKPVAGALLYAYHTSTTGWYSDRAPHFTNDDGKGGDSRHARLFGYVRTDAQGRFVLRTIRPGGYPQSELPEHVHWHASLDGRPIGGGELCFADDPRLTAEMRAKPEAGMTIAKPAREGDTLLFETTFAVAPPAPAPAPAPPPAKK